MEKLIEEFTIFVPLCKDQLELQTISNFFVVFPTSVSGGGELKKKNKNKTPLFCFFHFLQY